MESPLKRAIQVSAVVLRASVLSLSATAAMSAAERVDAVLERGFAEAVRPFLGAYCVGCHSGSAPAAQFNLSRYSTMGAIRGLCWRGG